MEISRGQGRASGRRPLEVMQRPNLFGYAFGLSRLSSRAGGGCRSAGGTRSGGVVRSGGTTLWGGAFRSELVGGGSLRSEGVDG